MRKNLTFHKTTFCQEIRLDQIRIFQNKCPKIEFGQKIKMLVKSLSFG